MWLNNLLGNSTSQAEEREAGPVGNYNIRSSWVLVRLVQVAPV